MGVTDLIEEINEFDIFPKIGICIALIFISLIFSRYGVIRPWLRIVKKTKNEWDDMLVVPISNRLYLFVLVGGINLSILWIDA